MRWTPCRWPPATTYASAVAGFILRKSTEERFAATSRASGATCYGLRVHLVVTEAGEPVEFALAAGSEADVSVFKDLELDLPEGSIICADKAYTDYD